MVITPLACPMITEPCPGDFDDSRSKASPPTHPVRHHRQAEGGEVAQQPPLRLSGGGQLGPGDQQDVAVDSARTAQLHCHSR